MHFKAKFAFKMILSFKTEKHFRSTLFLRICWFLVKVFDSGMHFVSHQHSCFASLAGIASLCSSDQLPKSVGTTLLQQNYPVHITVFTGNAFQVKGYSHNWQTSFPKEQPHI